MTATVVSWLRPNDVLLMTCTSWTSCQRLWSADSDQMMYYSWPVHHEHHASDCGQLTQTKWCITHDLYIMNIMPATVVSWLRPNDVLLMTCTSWTSCQRLWSADSDQMMYYSWPVHHEHHASDCGQLTQTKWCITHDLYIMNIMPAPVVSWLRPNDVLLMTCTSWTYSWHVHHEHHDSACGQLTQTKWCITHRNVWEASCHLPHSQARLPKVTVCDLEKPSCTVNARPMTPADRRSGLDNMCTLGP